MATLKSSLKAACSNCSMIPFCQNAIWFMGVLIPPLTRNSWITARIPQRFLSRCFKVHSGSPPSASCSWAAPASRADSFWIHPVSRKKDWFDGFSCNRFAKSDRQSSTVLEPWVREPSASISANIRSNAFSNATTFCNSADEMVRDISRRRAST